MIRVFDTRLTDADRQAVADCVASNWVGPGKLVAKFEEMLCEATGKKHAVCCNSGTTALMLCLGEIDLPIITGVKVPAYGMHAAAEMARLWKLDVIPYDIGMSPSVEGFEVTVCINLNGLPCGSRYDIEDACQSIGITGAFQCRLSTLSFSPQKLVTTGQGGAVLTDDESVAEGIRGFIDHGGGWRETRIHQRIGGNWRMSDLNAALGVSQMKRLPVLLERRERVHERYRHRMEVSCGWCVTTRSLRAQSLIEHLRERGIEALQPYRPLHHHPPFDTYDSFPNAEREAREVVYLPSHIHLTDDEIDRVCAAVEKFTG